MPRSCAEAGRGRCAGAAHATRARRDAGVEGSLRVWPAFGKPWVETAVANDRLRPRGETGLAWVGLPVSASGNPIRRTPTGHRPGRSTRRMLKTVYLRFGADENEPGLSFEPGPMTVFVGPNNSGKSLALRELESYVESGGEQL